jgi:hypothetical protein
MNAKLRALMLISGLTVGGLSLSSCGKEEQEQFGFTCIELMKGAGVDGDPFAGTAKIQVTMSYEPCLQDYYENKHPEMRYDGPADKGGAVFEEWKERLCTDDVERRIDCEVESFSQNIATGGINPLYNMTIVYNIPSPDMLAGRRILWGPAPLEAYAECPASPNDLPFVRLTGLSDIIGINGAGVPIWNLQSYGATPRGLIQASGSGCLQVPVKN